MNPWAKKRRIPPPEIMRALCESYNQEPERRLFGPSSIDGYRIHINPDGSAVWMEGHESKDMQFVLGNGVGDAIERCIIRRGLMWPNHVSHAHRFIKSLPENHPLKHILQLARICRMERRFCGEEDW